MKKIKSENDSNEINSNAEDEVLKRLLELKEMYKEQRELNGVIWLSILIQK